MFTRAAAKIGLDLPVVAGYSAFVALGVSESRLRAQLASRRWTRLGLAVVRHNGELTHEERCTVARINCGPRAVLTSFTGLQTWGLRGWEREEVHVLAPRGTTTPKNLGFRVQLHRVFDWDDAQVSAVRQLHRAAPALIVAARSFSSARPACGILAAAVQQRVVRSAELRAAATAATRSRHRAALLLAIDDIAQGAQALSEIDFVRLCRRNGLPPPDQQTVRRDAAGRRRYLDATWRLPDGRLLVVEVDGALHLVQARWWSDQLRQNDLALNGALVLRFPSAVVRHEEHVVVAQLRQALADNHVQTRP